MRWFGFRDRSFCLVSTKPVRSRIWACNTKGKFQLYIKQFLCQQKLDSMLKRAEKARLRQIPWHLVSCLLKYLVDRSTYIGYIGCKTVMWKMSLNLKVQDIRVDHLLPSPASMLPKPSSQHATNSATLSILLIAINFQCMSLTFSFSWILFNLYYDFAS
jgi:hypothetical protein